MATIGTLTVKLGLVSVEFDKGVAGAKQRAKELQGAFNDLSADIKTLYGHWKTLGGGLGVGALGIAALVQQTLSFSNTIKDLAEGFDISIAKTLQFKNALQTSGVSGESASKIMSKLFSSISDARKGNEETISQFEQIGISFKEISSLSPEKAINRIFEALNNNSKSTFERVKFIKDFLGRGAAGMDVAGVAKGLNIDIREYQKSSDAVEKLGRVSDNLKTSMDNLMIAFANVTAPFTRGGTISIEKFTAALYAITASIVISRVLVLSQTILLLASSFTSLAVASSAMLLVGSRLAALAGPIGIVAGAITYFALTQSEQKPKSNSRDRFSLGGSPSKKETQPKIPTNEKSKSQDEIEIEEKEQIRPVIEAANARLYLQKQMIGLMGEESALKIKALNADKYQIELEQLSINLKKEDAAAQSVRSIALLKDKKSQEEINVIERTYAEAQKEILAKANNGSKEIIARRNKEIELIEKQINFDKILNNLGIERSIFEARLITISENDYKIASETLNVKTQIANIEQKISEARDKMGAGSLFDAEEKRLRNQQKQIIETGEIKKTLISQQTEKEVGLILNQIELTKDLQKLSIYGLELESQKVTMTDYDYNVAIETLQLTRRIAEFNKQIVELKQKHGEGKIYETEKAVIQQQIADETALSNVRLNSMVIDEQRRKSFADGWSGAFLRFRQDSENAGKLGADVFNSFVGSMNSALDSFVKTGKLGFKDFARSVIQNIMSMMLQFQAMQMLTSSMKFMGMDKGNFFGGGLLSKIFGGGGSGMGGPALTEGGMPLIGSFNSRAAAGGYISGPTLVGENGPELFIPRRGGTIIPNQQLSNMGSAPSVVYNGPYIANMSAIDTQSAAQFLARNKDSVWAANQSASRSVPQSR